MSYSNLTDNGMIYDSQSYPIKLFYIKRDQIFISWGRYGLYKYLQNCLISFFCYLFSLCRHLKIVNFRKHLVFFTNLIFEDFISCGLKQKQFKNINSVRTFRSCSPVVNKVVRNIRSRAVSKDRGDVELEEGEYLSEESD